MRYSIAINTMLILLLLVSGCGISDKEGKNDSIESKGVEIRGVPSFTKNGVIMAYMNQGTFIVKLFDWQTKEVKQFTFSRPIYNPKLSPNGRKLFYTQLSEHGYFSELWTLDLEIGQKLRLTNEENGDVYSYAVAPDGSCLVFTAFLDSLNHQIISLISLASPPQTHSLSGDMPQMSIDDLARLTFSPDGKKVIFPYEGEIYVVDVSKCQITKVYVGKSIHFLSAFSHYGIFIGRQDGYYQIFSTDLQTEELRQLTFDRTNKLLPLIGEDGYLCYLDTGNTLNLRKLSYLIWLTGRNSTSVFRDYRNDWGRLAWGESYALEFLITAYKAFDDEYFLREFVNHTESVLEDMDIKLDIKDYNGISTYGWSATRYSADKESRMRCVVHDGMIGVPLAKFVKLTRDRGYSDPTIAKVAQESLETLRHLVELHSEEWIEHDVDTLGITRQGEGYYIFPKGSPARTDGINLPFNQQNRLGTLLISLYEIDGESHYLDKALKLGRVFRRHLITDDKGFKWRYWWGKASTGWNEAEKISTNMPSYKGHQGFDSVGYATMELEFITKLASYGVFDNEDMQKFVNTYLNPDSVIHFHNSKTGALLSQYSNGKIVLKMREIDALNEQWKYVPYLGLVLGDDGNTTWKLKKVNINAESKPVVLFEGDNLIYFTKSGANIAVICKGQDQPYNVKILPIVEDKQSRVASPENGK